MRGFRPNHRLMLRRLLCALLCLALWRGPVVWVHEHSEVVDGDGAAVEAPEGISLAGLSLGGHLRAFHHEHLELGRDGCWHLHVGLLRDLVGSGCPNEGGNDEPGDEPLSPVELRTANGLVDPGIKTPIELSAPVIASGGRQFMERVRAVPSGSFLQSYLGHPARELTGVLRC